MPESSRIVALLGPTNTGKTHRAIERLLEHETGTLGLPLRLLAREAYDRITARIGRDAVALVTGEEKLVPRRPRYYVATVEAMPLGRDVEFVGVDEIQLAAHPERGHVFTDRLLHARGTRETWFLGSDTMKPLMRSLVPTAQIEEHPRLSRLTFAGSAKLARLPPRTAVVAFSMDRVYELAERLRALRGGTAVVLGALSPRTRNAQVAMFQAGEVDTIVATDAIGMGLNLDVTHVAFAARHKFDGREKRELDDAELAQIAGRAGRYVADGTFGTVAPLELDPGAVLAVESHRFPALRRLRFRPHHLDFANAEALLASLEVPPDRPGLVATSAADDQRAFEALSLVPEVRRRLASPADVELLWNVASIPDFRKLLFEAHVDDLRAIYLELSTRGRVSSEFFEAAITPLGAPAHDVDTLLARITSLRTWSYVANKGQWVDDETRWQEQTRALEETLSDGLHAALTARFVAVPAKRTRAARPRPRAVTRAADRIDERPAVDDSHPFARLRDLVVDDSGALTDLPPDDDLDRLADAPHEAFAVAADATISASALPLARLTLGPRLILPQVKMLPVEDLSPGSRLRLEKRLLAFARDTAARLLVPIDALRVSSEPSVRGLAFWLEEGLGTALYADVATLVEALDPVSRALIDEHRVAIGRLAVYSVEMLSPRASTTRAILLRAAGHDVPAIAKGTTSIARRGRDRTLVALGFVPLGPRAVRADVAERIAAAVVAGDDLTRLGSWLGAGRADADRVRRAVETALKRGPTALSPEEPERSEPDQGEK